MGGVPTTTATDLRAVADADLVILLTASADAVLRAEHLAPGAVVIDATQPRNTSPGLLVERPDVLVLDGGVVDVPSLRLHGSDIGLPDGRAYACFAETAMLALSGQRQHFSIGNPGLDLVDRTRGLAADLAHLGFVPAAPTSFGRPVAALAPGRGRGGGVTRVVLLGGGYVTLHAYAALARGLRREIRRGEVELVVVTADPAHSYHGFTGEVLAGLLPYARTRTPVAGAMPPARGSSTASSPRSTASAGP